MLFNSYVFLFWFLPLTLAGYHALQWGGRGRLSRLWLVGCSFYFYGWWNPSYLPLLLFSIAANFGLGRVVMPGHAHRRAAIALGIVLNLGLLGYFKYANFFVDNLNDLAGTSFTLHRIVLPLAISFFTFQQIAYLVDSYRGKTRAYRLLDYCLFVTFFPQLIAGPIVQHREMFPQFERPPDSRRARTDLAVGSMIFAIGLFKKVVIADSVAGIATATFGAAHQGISPGFAEAWVATSAYTFQIYFDFSGYSDMAIGLGRMFGFLLPQNFDSPYKAKSAIEFWRRWHMTLSRFLRDYLYIPLGGNRRGNTRRYVNLMLTMLLGGLWHGAAWTFVAWGGLHGIYLVVNHGWRAARRLLGGERYSGFGIPGLSRAVTLLSVAVGWIFFRAESFEAGWRILVSAFCGNGFTWATPYASGPELMLLALLLVVVSVLPNTQEFMARYQPAIDFDPSRASSRRGAWRPEPRWALVAAAMALASVMKLTHYSEFLYYQF